MVNIPYMDPMGTDLAVKKQMHWKKAKLGNSAEWPFLGWLSQVTLSMGPPTIEGSKGHGLNYLEYVFLGYLGVSILKSFKFLPLNLKQI